MALVQRGGCSFYIRSIRRGDRVTSEYLGSGAVALDLAYGKAEARRGREERRKILRRDLALWSEFDAAFSDLCNLNRAHARAAMYAAGFYLHHRSWRPRGGRMATPTTLANVTNVDVPAEIRDRVDEFLQRRDKDELSAKDCVVFFDSLREELSPVSYRWVIKRLACRFNQCDFLMPIDPRAQAQQKLVSWLAEGWGLCSTQKRADPADLEIQRRYLDVLRYELADSDAPLIEQMLADQIVLSCTEAHGLTRRVVESEKTWSLEDATHYDQRRDRATRRMHESIKLLHLIRTKAGPALQVNVQQNVTIPNPPCNALPSLGT